jgi:hypothetical protein
MNAGASTYAGPSPIEGSGTAWVLLGSWALSPARPTPIHPRPERRGFSALLVSQMVSYTGTSTIHPNCTGEQTFTEDGTGVVTHFDIFVAPSGAEFTFVQTDPGAVSAGSERRVKRQVEKPDHE